jgi:hypothetical protein
MSIYLRLISLAASAILAAAVNCSPSPPGPPAPVRLSQDVVVECAGQRAEGARVYLDSTASGDQAATTNADGWVRFTTTPDTRDVTLHVDATADCLRDDRVVDTQGVEHIAGGTPGPFLVPLAPRPPPFPKRLGVVRFDNRVAVDDTGQFNPLGATLFPLAYMVEHDRATFDRDVAALARAGVDYVRALAVVGGCNCPPNDAWIDRPVNPNAPGWAAAIAAATDRAYDVFGVRVQWTIFGGVEWTPTAASRERVVDQMADIVKARPHKVFAVEIANEGSHGKFPGESGEQEMRALARRLRDRGVVNRLAITNADSTSACRLYGGSAADFVTIHYEREPGPDGWRSVRQPWGGNEIADECGWQGVPRALANNEPTGPNLSQSDVSLNDATRIALSYATTFVAGNGAYVLHAGPGVFWGGQWGDRPELGRKHHFDEIEGWAGIAAALVAAKSYVPVVGNCARHNGHWDSSPFDFRPVLDQTLNRAYSTTCGDQVFTVLLGLTADATVPARVTGTFDVLDAQGVVRQTFQAVAGQSVTIRRVAAGQMLRSR